MYSWRLQINVFVFFFFETLLLFVHHKLAFSFNGLRCFLFYQANEPEKEQNKVKVQKYLPEVKCSKTRNNKKKLPVVHLRRCKNITHA